jgi:protein TorT
MIAYLRGRSRAFGRAAEEKTNMSSKRLGRVGVTLVSGLAAMTVAANVASADEKWWPLKVNDVSSGKPVSAEYTPLDKAEKPYNICVLFPHMKDSFWVAVAYGIVKQSQALGVNMTLYEAGGYENLPKQLSQFDDCVASGASAIVIGAISEAGVSKKFAEAAAKGIPVIGVANPTTPGALPAAVFVDFKQMGYMTGEALVKGLKGDEKANVVTFPGPAGSGWAESFNDGFKAAAATSPAVKVLGEKFGDSGVAVQLQLIQDALQAYPSMNVIWGTAPTAEAAVGAVAEAGRSDIKIISSYENQAMLDALKRGDIMAFATQYPVGEGAISIDEAVRLIEKKPVMSFVQPLPDVVVKGGEDKINMDLVLAPGSWTPVYSVKQ